MDVVGTFNCEYRTGRTVQTDVNTGSAAGSVSYRDVLLNPDQRAITLLRPLVLDLGAVAKGLAIDMAARELGPLEDYAIDAGGDLYVAVNQFGNVLALPLAEHVARQSFEMVPRIRDCAVGEHSLLQIDAIVDEAVDFSRTTDRFDRSIRGGLRACDHRSRVLGCF